MAKNTKGTVVTIPNLGASTPNIQLDPSRIPLGIEMPAAFSGTALTFKASSQNGGTPVPLYFESTLYSVSCAASRFISLNRAAFEGVKFLQIVSNAGGGESAARDLVLVTGE
jgi:hypothetical protein